MSPDPSGNPKINGGFTYGDLIDAIEKRDRSKIEDIFEEFKVKPFFDGNFPYELEVWKNVELLRAGFSDARLELERIEREKPKESDASRALVRYYLGIRASQQALHHIDIMFSRAEDDAALTTACILKAEYIEAAQDTRAATSFLLSQIDKISDLQSLSRLFEELGDRFKKDKRELLAIAAYERALACDVHNTRARFQLAWLYGENDALRTLSVRHYRILLRQNPNYWSAENNLGVEYEKLGLQYFKIEAWRAAFSRGEDYPLGNLMFAYLDKGFVDEAEKLYDEAPSYRKSSERVVAAYNNLRKIKDDEREKLDEVREGAETIWRELDNCKVDFGKEGEDWIGAWKQMRGGAILKVSRSGEFTEFEETDGAIVCKGLAKAPEGVAIISINEENKNYKNNLGLLSFAGPYSAGHFVIVAMVEGLKIIHVKDQKLISARYYVKAA